MAENDGDFGTFFAGFVIGGLVGAAVALIMAPQSGEETRTFIKEKGIELKDRATEYSQDARTRAAKALEDAKARVDETMEELRARTSDLNRLTKDWVARFQTPTGEASEEGQPASEPEPGAE
jgi:gas vesicle protein